MKRIKNILWILATIVLIIKIFFRDEISKELHYTLAWCLLIWLLILIILEVITRKK